MNRNQSVYRLALAALLCAVGILIPMVIPFPLKLYIPPMSFTLASHVAIFLSMFISPMTAFAVSIGTTIGFVFSGLPLDVWLRALSHVVWAVLGALWLKKHPDTLYKPASTTIFCAAIALLHAALELVTIFSLYLGGVTGMAEKFGSLGFTGLFLLVGLGTVLHSCVDYVLSILVWRPLRHVNGMAAVASVH